MAAVLFPEESRLREYIDSILGQYNAKQLSVLSRKDVFEKLVLIMKNEDVNSDNEDDVDDKPYRQLIDKQINKENYDLAKKVLEEAVERLQNDEEKNKGKKRKLKDESNEDLAEWSDKDMSRKEVLAKTVSQLSMGPATYKGLDKANPAEYLSALTEKITKYCQKNGVIPDDEDRLPSKSEIASFAKRRQEEKEMEGMDTSNIIDEKPRRLGKDAGGSSDEQESSEESNDEQNENSENKHKKAKTAVKVDDRAAVEENNEDDEDEDESDYNDSEDSEGSGDSDDSGEDDEAEDDEDEEDYEDED